MTFILCIECVFHRGNWSRRSLDRQSIQGTPGPILYTLLQETISPVCSITYQCASHASFAQLRRGNWSPAKLHHKLTSQFNDAKRPLTASGTGWLSPHRSPSGTGWLLHTQISTSWFPTRSLSSRITGLKGLKLESPAPVLGASVVQPKGVKLESPAPV